MPPPSWPRKEWPDARDGLGEGSTSDSREGGSLRSLFQIPPWPQPNEAAPVWGRPMMVAELEPQAVVPASAEGVLGWDVVGDMELLANDSFRRYPT